MSTDGRFIPLWRKWDVTPFPHASFIFQEPAAVDIAVEGAVADRAAQPSRPPHMLTVGWSRKLALKPAVPKTSRAVFEPAEFLFPRILPFSYYQPMTNFQRSELVVLLLGERSSLTAMLSSAIDRNDPMGSYSSVQTSLAENRFFLALAIDGFDSGDPAGPCRNF